MLYRNRSIKGYLNDLAMKKPAPGGGSAAALVGATGVALLSMVANFTVGKDRYKRFEKDIKKVLNALEKIRKKLLELVDLDVITYKRVIRNKKSSLTQYQNSLKEATIIPVKISELSFRALGFCSVLEKKGNKYLISDVDVANVLLRAAIKSAIVNVKVNLPYIKDKKFITKINHQLKSWRV
jgi:formiminotetrahydrofolate cyclodeaminase